MPFMKFIQVFDSVTTRLLHGHAWRLILTGGMFLGACLYLRPSSSRPPSRQQCKEQYLDAGEVEDGNLAGENKVAPAEPDGVPINRDYNGITKKQLPEAHLGLQTLHNCDEPTIDIVAVHGLGAHSAYAWLWLPKNNPPNCRGYPSKPYNWLTELLPEKLCCRVMAFNYESKWNYDSPQQRLSNISGVLLDSLRNNREKAVDRPLIFIGHSFGGNIIEQAIVSATRHRSKYLPIAESTVGVIFLGTPHRGCRAATWGKCIASLAPTALSTEKKLPEALEELTDSLVDRLHDFSCWLFSESVSVICVFEKLKTDFSSRMPSLAKNLVSFKELVVPEASACIDGHCKIALDTDHFKINKFYGPDDPSFKLVYPEIVRMAQNAKGTLDRRRDPKRIPIDQSSTSGDLRKFLQEMRVKNPRDVLADIQTQKGERVGNTCEWILRRAEFLTWAAPAVDDRPQLLRLVGSPGIGKTMLSTFIVETLREKVEKSSGKALIYFFCDDKHQDRRTSTAIIRSLIWQLLLQRNELFEHVTLDFEAQGTTLFENFSALWRIFQCMLQDERAGQVFIVIDALDESETATREGLLQGIRKLFKSTERTGRFNLLITCRPDISDIERQLNSLGTSLRVDSAKINNDLFQYIDVKANGLTDVRGVDYPSDLKEYVRRSLQKEAGGTFLWVSIMIAQLGGVVMHEVKKTLTNLPHGLDETYAAILDRIPLCNRETARFILLCMVAARNPLTKGEMLAAFATWKSRSIRENLSVYADIVSSCSSILYVAHAWIGDYETINFCHKSVKDFLLREVSRADRKWYHTATDEANLLLFEACWESLSADDLCNPVYYGEDEPIRLYMTSWPELQNHFTQHPFLSYSFREWADHAIASYPAVLDDLHGVKFNVKKAPTLRDTWLLRASREGQETVVLRLLEKGANINAKHGHTVLSWAAASGNEAFVDALLEKGADINGKDDHDQTPLSRAAENGHDAVSQLLLNKGADIEAKDALLCQTALLRAASNGHLTVVKLLLERGANMNARDNFGHAPLSCAARYGHEAIVKLLLQKGADIEAKDKYLNQTALLPAAVYGHEAVVKVLLEKGANIEVQDSEFGQAALSLAAAQGHNAIAMLLLGVGADIEAKSDRGLTALSWAALCGREATVKFLLKKGANIEAKDAIGRTALLLAVVYGHEAVVKVLVDEGADIETTNAEGQTPLLLAIKDNHEGIAKLLLDEGARAEVP